jgi:hypothetical protein
MKRLWLGAALGCLGLVALFGGFEKIQAGDFKSVGLDYASMNATRRMASSYPGFAVFSFSNADGDTTSDSLDFTTPLVIESIGVDIDSTDSLHTPDTTIVQDTAYWDSTTWVTTTIDCDTTIGMNIDTDSTPPDTTYDTLIVCDTSYAYKDTLFADSILSITPDTTIDFDTTVLYDTATVWDSSYAVEVRAFNIRGPMFPSMFDAPARIIYRDAAQRTDTLYWPDPTFKNGASLLCDGVPIPDLGWTPVQIEEFWVEMEDSMSAFSIMVLYD